MRTPLSVLVACAGALWVRSPLAVGSHWVWHLPLPWQRVVTGLQVVVTALAVAWVAGAFLATGWRRLWALTPAALAAGLLSAYLANRWLLWPGLLRCPDLLRMMITEWPARAVILLVPALAAAALMGSLPGKPTASRTDTGMAARRLRLRRGLLAACSIAAAVAALWWATAGVGQCQRFRWELRRGIWLVSTLNFAEAVPVFEGILRWCPRSHYTRGRLGWVLLRSGRPREAASEFRAVLAARPRYPYMRTGLGECLTLEGRYAEGQRELQAAIAEDPRDAEAYYWLGNLMMASKRYAEAVGELRRAVDLAPAQGPNWRALADAVISLGDQSTTRQTIAQMRAALQVQPVVADLHASLGRLLEVEEGANAARITLEAALAVDPDCFSARYELARLAAAKGDSRTALSHLDHLSGKRLWAGDAELRERALAAIYTAMGRAADARKAAQAADAHKRQAQHPQ